MIKFILNNEKVIPRNHTKFICRIFNNCKISNRASVEDGKISCMCNGAIFTKANTIGMKSVILRFQNFKFYHKFHKKIVRIQITMYHLMYLYDIIFEKYLFYLTILRKNYFFIEHCTIRESIRSSYESFILFAIWRIVRWTILQPIKPKTSTIECIITSPHISSRTTGLVGW